MKKSYRWLGILSALSLAGAAQTGPAFLYLGPVGTYSDQVAQQVAAARDWTPTLAGSITDVSNGVAAGAAPTA